MQTYVDVIKSVNGNREPVVTCSFGGKSWVSIRVMLGLASGVPRGRVGDLVKISTRVITINFRVKG